MARPPDGSSNMQQPAVLAWLNAFLYLCKRTSSVEPPPVVGYAACSASYKALTDNYHIVKAPVSVLMDESGQTL